MERTSPIGMVISGHTVEAMKGITASRLSNEPIISSQDEPLGIGRAFDHISAGLFKPISLPAGMWTNEYITGTHTTLAHVPTISKGSDPIIPPMMNQEQDRTRQQLFKQQALVQHII